MVLPEFYKAITHIIGLCRKMYIVRHRIYRKKGGSPPPKVEPHSVFNYIMVHFLEASPIFSFSGLIQHIDKSMCSKINTLK
jgi:hypothetical protein